MKKTKGNLRPSSSMSHANAEMLPSARIHCDAGRIRVGDRCYQSASDALSAYLQQFEGKQQSSPHLKSSLRSTPVDTLTRKSNHDRVSPAVHWKHEPANVTGLLMGSHSPDETSGASINGISSALSSHLYNGESPSKQSSKLSVSFALPDSDDDFKQHSRQSANSSGFSQSSGSQHHSRSVIRDKQHKSPASFNTSQTNSSRLSGSSQQGSTSSSVPHHATVPAKEVSVALFSNGLADSGLPKTNRLVHNGQDAVSEGWKEAPKSSGPTRAEGQRARSEVEMLLTEIPTENDLKAMNQKSVGEEKLKSMLKDTSIPESSSNSSDKSALQQEVEEALSRSAQLLENIKTDVLVSPRCVSDVGSLSTDILLSINPQNPADALRGATSRESRSRHRYSYHTPAHHPRSVSVDPVPSALEQRTSYNSGRRRSLESLGLHSSLGDSVLQDLNSSMSALSESESILKRLNTINGQSSLVFTHNRPMETRATGQTGPPSWIQELIPSTSSKTLNGAEWTDSLFSERSVSGGRQAPSWVNGLEQSDIVSSVDTQDLRNSAKKFVLEGTKKMPGSDLAQASSVTAGKADDSTVSDLSYAGPGLNYSDLMTSPASSRQKEMFNSQLNRKSSSRLSRNNSFSGVGSPATHKRDVDRSKPPVTLSRIYQDLAGVDLTRPKTHAGVANLNSSFGPDSDASILRRKVREESVNAKESMGKYLSQLNGGADGVNCGEGGALTQMSGLPRCSSVDMLNRMGGHGDMPSDITGASPITKDSDFSSKMFLEDPTLTPARQSRGVVSSTGLNHATGLKQNPDDDQDLLDGDRPWETMLPSFKAPVHVGDSSPAGAQGSMARPETPTLSGGQQPGSMEALKQMLFRLQSEETSTGETSAAATVHTLQENGESSQLIPALKDYDFEAEPGGQSLERALHHLGRLKTLVQTGTSPSPLSAHQQEQATSSQPLDEQNT